MCQIELPGFVRQFIFGDNLTIMIKHDERIVIRAIALCFKPHLKPEEAMIYCNHQHTQFARNCAEMGIFKNERGYNSKKDLDRLMGENQGKS